MDASPQKFFEKLAGAKYATSIDMHGVGRRFVYVLRSERDAERHYVGVTSDVEERLQWHNAGPSGYTLQHRPWRVVVSLEFPDERAAIRFEKYLKSGSGRAFARHHFASTDSPAAAAAGCDR